MNSAENKKELSKACGKYLLASRMASVSEIRDAVLSKRRRYTVISNNLHAKEVIVGNGERRRRYILSVKILLRHGDRKCNDTWSRIQHNLEGLQVLEFRTNSHKFFRRNEITSNVRNLLNKLKITTPILVAELEKL